MSAKRLPVWLFGSFLLLSGLVCSLHAGSVPQSLETEDYQELLKRSPFTRSLNVPGNLVLTGVAVMNGGPVATFIDLNAGRQVIISETPNERGWRLLEVRRMNQLKDAMAIIALENGQTIRAFHDAELIQKARQQIRAGRSGGGSFGRGKNRILPGWILEMEDPELKGLAIQSFIEGGGFDRAPFQAVEMALSVPEPQARGPAVSAAFGRLGGGVGGIEIRDAVNRLNAIPQGRDRDFAINGLAHGLVGRDPAGAIKWAQTISNEGFRNVVVRNVSRRIEAQRQPRRN